METLIITLLVTSLITLIKLAYDYAVIQDVLNHDGPIDFEKGTKKNRIRITKGKKVIDSFTGDGGS